MKAKEVSAKSDRFMRKITTNMDQRAVGNDTFDTMID